MGQFCKLAIRYLEAASMKRRSNPLPIVISVNVGRTVTFVDPCVSPSQPEIITFWEMAAVRAQLTVMFHVLTLPICSSSKSVQGATFIYPRCSCGGDH